MGFPPNVVEKALLDCGRYCCNCHKFCSFKIETHHIVSPADGGDDSYDNCIPLCFDCHADVRAYDPKHPIGRSYKPSELKERRDRWYEKVKNGHALTTNPEYIEIDRKLFLVVKDALNEKGSMEFLRRHDFHGAFKLERLEGLYAFGSLSEKSECEFLDADMEGLRGRLYNDILKFLKAVGEHTFPVDNKPDLWNRIYDDPEDDDRFIAKYEKLSEEEFDAKAEKKREFISKVRNELNELSTQVWNTYDEFIRFGRRKLVV
ncbi:hypothetical protein DCC62_30360 [candidate division KSB1 bacterium]|nr:MAG: hypothetical protein DCC62_30360 [candidate division KSB1 bacterium]